MKRASVKTLVITSSYPSGQDDAAGHFVEAEVQRLREAGEDVDVFAAGAGLSTAKVFFAGGSQLFAHPGALPRLKKRPLRILGLFAPSFRALLRSRERQYQKVIAHWLYPGALPWAYFFCSPETRLEVVMHGSDVRLAGRLPRLFLARSLAWLAKRQARLCLVSHALKEELLSYTLNPETRAFVEKAAVRPASIVLPVLPPQAALRRELGVSPETRLVTVVGRLVSSKRVATALAAALLIPESDIVVLGDGPLRAELQKTFPTVRFLGKNPRKETLSWLRAADVLISASQLEGAPTVIREARELGTPAVTVNSGDVAQWADTDPELYVISAGN